MIITIDGPAGTGKSMVAKAVADRLSFDFLDTGAMYRAVGLAALRRGIDLQDARQLAFAAKQARIEFDFAKRPPEILLNKEPVAGLLRSDEATQAASYVAQIPAVRQLLVEQQRKIGQSRPNIVTEGRDQGTVVFPDAQFKFYLDATPAERARRRANQLRARGEMVDIADLQRKIIERDKRDSSRAVGPLAVPQGAVRIDTTHLSEQEVVDRIVAQIGKSTNEGN